MDKQAKVGLGVIVTAQLVKKDGTVKELGVLKSERVDEVS